MRFSSWLFIIFMLLCGMGDNSNAQPTNSVQNPGFANGLRGWTQCGGVPASITHAVVHSGNSAARIGSRGQKEIAGNSAICQKIAVPAEGILSFWTRETSTEGDPSAAWQEAGFTDVSGSKTALFKHLRTSHGWEHHLYQLAPYSGQTVTLFFGVHGNGAATGATVLYLADIIVATPHQVKTAEPEATASPRPFATVSPPIAQTTTPIVPAAAPASCPNDQCGVERWHVKTMVDSQATGVNLTPQDSNIAVLRALPYPGGNPKALLHDDQRYPAAELQVYKLTAVLTAFKAETDEDIHLALADAANSTLTMIAEIPNPNCSGVCSSLFHDTISNVHGIFTNCLGEPTASYQSPPMGTRIEITGVGFFDKVHGQRGVAPNGIEIHPVLGLRFISGACRQ